jgi:hypothetical protein
MNTQIRAANSTSSDRNVQAAVVDRIIAVTESGLRSLRSLPMPAGDASTLKQVYADVDRVMSDARQVAAALRDNNATTGRRVSQTLSNDARVANNAATAYGMTVCGEPT